MFGTIRKHSTWLWVVIIALMIVSLVVFFNPSADPGSGRGGVQLGKIDGEAISREDYASAEREAMLEYFMNYGEWPSARSNFDLQKETYLRLFLLKKIEDHNIYVDDEAVAQAANGFLARAGGGQRVPLDEFVQRALRPHATEEDFARYIRHYLALQQLFSVVGLPGDLVTPQEARAFYVRQHQPLAAQVLFYSGTNYQTGVATPTPEALLEFYTNRSYMYELPERVQVHYIAFSASNYLAQADRELSAITNLNEIIEQEYQQRGTNAFSDAASPEDAKQKLREERRKQQALLAAYRQAEQFMDTLLSGERAPTTDDFLALARTNNLNVQLTQPFDQENGPEGLDVGPNLTTTAFRLTTEEPMADRPLVAEDAIYAIALARRVPVELQPFDAVKERVEEDYRRTRAIENAVQAGTTFARSVQQAIQDGQAFSNVVQQANLHPIRVEALSLASTNAPEIEDHIALPQFKQVAFSTEPGTVSDFVRTAGGGFIVYVEGLMPVDETRMQAELPAFTEMVRRARRRDAINTWIDTEATRSLRETPIMQQQQAPAGAGAARS